MQTAKDIYNFLEKNHPYYLKDYLIRIAKDEIDYNFSSQYIIEDLFIDKVANSIIEEFSLLLEFASYEYIEEANSPLIPEKKEKFKLKRNGIKDIHPYDEFMGLELDNYKESWHA